MKRFTIEQRLKMIMSLKRNFAKYQERFQNESKTRDFGYKVREAFKIINGKWLFIEHFELIITTKCSLNCMGCSNLMPIYKEKGNAYFRDKDEIFKEIDKFVDSLDEVLNCRILGGEPLLHPNIKEIIEYLLSKKNIGTLHIITNGTIIPNLETLKVMSNPRVIVIFSDYGKFSRNMESCINEFEQKNIRYRINKDLKWSDLGDFSKREVTVEELKVQRKNCQFCCRTYLNGKFHLCPRSAFGTDLGYFDYTNDYVNVMELDSKEIIRKKTAELLYSKKYIDGCAYCLAATEFAKTLEPGKQLEK